MQQQNPQVLIDKTGFRGLWDSLATIAAYDKPTTLALLLNTSRYQALYGSFQYFYQTTPKQEGQKPKQPKQKLFATPTL